MALKFLLKSFLVVIVMSSSLSCLSPFASDMNPVPESVVTVIGPGCQMLLVRSIKPVLRSSAFSECISIVELNVEKWSVIRRMYCLSLRIISGLVGNYYVWLFLRYHAVIAVLYCNALLYSCTVFLSLSLLGSFLGDTAGLF